MEWMLALAIQPGTAADSMDVVRNGGGVIIVSGDKVEHEKDVIVRQFQHQLKLPEAIDELVEDIAADRVKIVIDQVYPFEEALTALKKTETRHARGKLVVTINHLIEYAQEKLLSSDLLGFSYFTIIVMSSRCSIY